MARTAFLGLGVMGFPMAGHLARAGHEVAVYNRTRSRAEAWGETHSGAGGRIADSPAAAAEGADLVFACLGADDDVRAVVLGEGGALSAMKQGAVLVDHTTASAHLARELAAAGGDRGVGFVDAPVSGGQAGAEAGQVVAMCGGAEADFEAARPVIEAYAKAVVRFGEAGAGQTTKMVNQICIAGIIQGAAEGLLFAERAGLDPKAVAGLVSQGAGGSWQLANRAETMTDGEFDFGFAVDWMRKDLGIALDQARDLGVSLPVAALVDQFYADVQAMGGGRWDTSSLIARLRRLQG